MTKKYKVIVLGALAATMIFSFSACGNADNRQDTSTTDIQESSLNVEMNDNAATEITDIDTEDNEAKENIDGESKILIAYFTAAENSGVDAVSSASYTVIDGEAVGRVRAVADMIREQTGGELFSIQTSIVYPADGGALIDQAAEEQNDNLRPELTSHIENLDDYEVIFVGFPNWWYDMPMVMYSFFEEYDFSDKTIIPFNVHNGSRFSGTISTIQNLEPSATVIEDGFTVSERSVADARSDVSEWLSGLGY